MFGIHGFDVIVDVVKVRFDRGGEVGEVVGKIYIVSLGGVEQERVLV